MSREKPIILLGSLTCLGTTAEEKCDFNKSKQVLGCLRNLLPDLFLSLSSSHHSTRSRSKLLLALQVNSESGVYLVPVEKDF